MKISSILSLAVIVSTLPTILVSQERIGGATGGIVSEVSDEGHLILEDGKIVELWGLQLVDHEFATRFLVGQKVGCVVIQITGERLISDCALGPQLENVPIAQRRNITRTVYSMDLFRWLDELDAYSYECGAETERQRSKRGTNRYAYFCSLAGVPRRTQTGIIYD